MNICFYTSRQPSASNLLNISHLVHKRPQHSYSFLTVGSSQPVKPSLVDLARSAYAQWRWRDGRFEFQNDLLQVKKTLLSYTLPFDQRQFSTYYADTVNDDKSIRFLRQLQPDVIIQAGAGILKEPVFSLAAKGTINVHHGIAPEIRGIESTFWCMFFGISEQIGVSCHFIDQHLDTGAVILQRSLPQKATTFAEAQVSNYLVGRDVLVESIDILDKATWEISSEGPVKSWYFGNVDPFLYYALKKRAFHPLMKISDKNFKMKEKRVVTIVNGK